MNKSFSVTKNGVALDPSLYNWDKKNAEGEAAWHMKKISIVTKE